MKPKPYSRLLLALMLFFGMAGLLRAEETGYKNVYIEWKSVEGAVKYKVEIKDPAKGPVLEQITDTVSLTARLRQGNFKMRIGAMNKFEKVDSWSEWADITVEIKNPPNPPQNIASEKTVAGDGKSMNVKLAWEAPAANRENVKNYLILKIDGEKTIRIAEPTATEFVVEGLDPKKNHYFEIYSVNEKGEESVECVKLKIGKIPEINIAVDLCYILPLAEFSDLFTYGAAARFSFLYRGLWLDRLDAGVKTGFYYFSGKQYDKDSYTSHADSALVVPAGILLQYRYDVYDKLSVTPSLSAGYSFHSMKYYENDADDNSTFWEPVVEAGVILGYDVMDSLRARLAIEYGIFFESDGPMSYLSIGAGVSRTFDWKL